MAKGLSLGNLFYAPAHKCFCKTERDCLSTPKPVYARDTTCFKIVLPYGYDRKD